MYQNLDIHNIESGIIKITFWRFPKKGGATCEDIKTECGYVSIDQQEGFFVGSISIDGKGELQIDVHINPESRKYIAKLKDFPDSTPPFKCLSIGRDKP